MNHREVGRYWNDNADAWSELARAGYDVYRDVLNTPAFLELLPNIQGLRGVDIGCGDGHNTQLLARLGAKITGVDVAEKFIRNARNSSAQDPPSIPYLVASAVELPFSDGTLDFATGFMSFMDIPETSRLLSEVYRVLKPKGFLQFSISHPCFDTPHRKKLRDEHGKTYAIEVGNYFHNCNGEVDKWIFKHAPHRAKANLRAFRIPRFTKPLGEWFNLLIDTGFQLERVDEPRPDDETIRRHPRLQDAQIVAYFLHIRARKPEVPHKAPSSYRLESSR